jgi:hypothetical protein
MKTSLSARRFALTAFISVAAIMPQGSRSGKPRAGCGSHVIALAKAHFPLSGTAKLTDTGALVCWKPQR